MKYKLFVCCALFVTNFYSQQVLDSTFVDIPYEGTNQGAHMLNWSLNGNNIYLYQYTHVKGEQVIASSEEIEKAKAKAKEIQSKKGFFSKLFSSVGRINNTQKETIIPSVTEIVVNANDFKDIATNTERFHKVDSLEEGKKVYFKRVSSSSMIELNPKYKEGKPIEHYYKDLSKTFKNTPKYDSKIIDLVEVGLKGEGVLGLKNLQPVVTKKEAIFTYDHYKGYITKVNKEVLKDFQYDERLRDYQLVKNSENQVGKVFSMWFKRKKSFTDYKILIYNLENNELIIRDLVFEVPRKIKVANKSLLAKKDLKILGTITIFGYHRKGKKNKDVYPVTMFDVIKIDDLGAVAYHKKVNLGTEKKYKNVFQPITIFEEESGDLDILNCSVLSLFKVKLERLKIQGENTVKLIFKQDFFERFNEERIYYSDYLGDYSNFQKVNKGYSVTKMIKERIEDTYEYTHQKVNYAILNDSLKPVFFKSIATFPSVKGLLKTQVIEEDEFHKIILLNKMNNFKLVKLYYGDQPKIEEYTLKLTFPKYSEKQLYFANFSNDFVLVDKENKIFYLQSQFYRKESANKIIERVGIAKIKY